MRVQSAESRLWETTQQKTRLWSSTNKYVAKTKTKTRRKMLCIERDSRDMTTRGSVVLDWILI